ncbi:hypothetical protein [Pontibacter anaerobius]|uniref:Phosphatidic acid phosphatase type 2/haloperoxidase domain-containing protein n=1 Tax=Pontibacter anaerobius TaxID=2993940 RepID=A0ABT3RG99_9BACT|nr:hypothetical protein [Pontibacter anaerobius]MCX2740861.1 hypothetical protein [Pontibacter anaerobius]
MMKKLLLLPLLFAWIAVEAQHKQEPAAEHYKTLQAHSTSINPARSWMDTVQYPGADYGSSITFLLAKPHYLTDQQFRQISQSVKAPANSSDQTRSELNYLLELQQRRTPEQEKRVAMLGEIGYWPQVNLLPNHPFYQENLKHLFFVSREVHGDGVTAANFPAISKLLQGAMQDMRLMEFTVKYQQLRPRPYHLEPQLNAMAKMSSPAFASGHTLWAYLQAYIWSEINPEKRGAFLAVADEIRKSREIMGIHYPSDNETARLLAHRMLIAYFNNKQFKADLKAAVAEWEANATALRTCKYNSSRFILYKTLHLQSNLTC